jgi:hypothetical protein
VFLFSFNIIKTATPTVASYTPILFLSTVEVGIFTSCLYKTAIIGITSYLEGRLFLANLPQA